MKRWIKITLIAAAVLAVLIVIAAIAVSPVAKNYIEKHDRELLGRSIRMERLRMNIFTGRLRIEGLRIGESADSATFFRLDSFDMRMRLWPLLGNRIVVKKISFAGPDVKIYQRGSAFSFDDIITRFAGDTTAVAATPEKPSKPWEVGIYDISIRNGRVFYKDLALNAEWGMNDVNLHIPGVYFSGEKTDVGAVLNFAEGGSLSTDVGYNIETSEFDIGIRLQDFALAGTLPYFRQSLDVTAVDGRLSADIRLRGNTEHLLSLTTEGTASLAGFALRDRQQRPVAGVDTLSVKLAEGDLGKMRFVFDRIYVSGLSALFEMTPEGNSLAALMKSPSAAEAASPTAVSASAATNPAPEAAPAPAAQITTSDAAGSTTPGPTLRIADLEIAKGRVTMRDLTMHRPFEYTVSEIRMRSRDFDPSKRNSMTIDARMQKTGSAKLRWEGTLDDMNNQNITLWLTNLDLRDFGPYCEHYTAYPLTKGNLTFRSQNVIRDRYLDGTNHLDMFEPKVDKKRKEIKAEMNIPLKLGLYVLKDKKGHVKMDLPVKGSLDSPEFSYRKIVLKAIGNVLLKVVTAPFSFLSGNKENLEYINIDPLQYVFTSEQYASLDKIAQALQDKPEMHIVLTQRVNMRRALPRQAAGALRMAYAEHLKSADTTGRQPMSMLEYEKIQQTDIRTPAIMAFADSLLAQLGISPQGLSADAKALALYREKATGQLARMMAARNKALAEYMQSTHGATAPAFRVQTLDSLALPNYAGRDRYTIALEVDGETVEVEADDDNTDAGTDAGIAPEDVQADSTGLGTGVPEGEAAGNGKAADAAVPASVSASAPASAAASAPASTSAPALASASASSGIPAGTDAEVSGNADAETSGGAAAVPVSGGADAETSGSETAVPAAGTAAGPDTAQ